MPDAATRDAPPAATTAWMTPLPHAIRFILQGDAAARAAAASVWEAAFSEEACRAVVAGTRATLWLGPDEYLLLDMTAGGGSESPTDGARSHSEIAQAPFVIAASLEHAMRGVPHSLVNVSHRQFALELSGSHAEAILSAACPLDLDSAEFPVGMCTRTVLAKADILLWRRREAAFHLEIWRSFGGYAVGLLREIAREFHGP